MIARFDHHPVQMELVLATLVCALLIVAALFIALFVTVQPVAPAVLPSEVLNPTIPDHSSIVTQMIL